MQKVGNQPLVVELQPEAVLRLDPSGLVEPLRLVIQAPNGKVCSTPGSPGGRPGSSG